MGACTSRAILFESGKHPTSEEYSRGQVKFISAPHRLVRDELRKEVQHNVRYKIREARNSISLIQVSSKSLQQKDV